MKFLGPILSLSLASVACIGQVGNQSGDKPNPPVPPTGTPTDMTKPPVNPPDVNLGMCSADTLAKPRAWRLTHTQVKNSLRDSIGFAPPTIDAFPGEGRIDAANSRNGFSNRADTLKISPLLADSYV
jgi:hypothetical protein